MIDGDEAALVDLLRHGEVGDGIPRFRGRTDDPLNERGWEQIRSVLGSAPPWSEVLTSPRRRCLAVAELLERTHGLPKLIEDDLAEIDFGDWEGRAISDIQAREAERLALFWSDPDAHAPPGAERMGEFSRRVLDVWKQLGPRYRGRHVLLVAHGGTIRVILAHVLGIPFERLWALEVPTAALSRVRLGADYAQLVFHNRRSPL